MSRLTTSASRRWVAWRSPLPLFHSYALVLCVLGVLAVGASERILPRFSVDDVLGRLRSEPINVFPGVPTMFHYLLDRAGAGGLGAPALRSASPPARSCPPR